jgi:hypothetical protein
MTPVLFYLAAASLDVDRITPDGRKTHVTNIDHCTASMFAAYLAWMRCTASGMAQHARCKQTRTASYEFAQCMIMIIGICTVANGACGQGR